MQEEQNTQNSTDNIGEKIIKPGSFFSKLDNFWYHYKWHTVAILLILIVVTVSTLQMCRREKYDIHIMYAGDEGISKLDPPDEPEYTKLLTAIKQVCADYDGDGEVVINLNTLFCPSDTSGFSPELLQTVENDREMLGDIMLASNETYLCLLSKSVFLEYEKHPPAKFTDLSGYGDGFEYTESKRGIYLSSTDFYSLAGVDILPEDTVICLRLRSEVYKSSESKKNFESAQKLLDAILSYSEG